MATAKNTRPATAAPKPAKAAKRIKVRATADGYYGNKFRRPGDVFSIDGSTHAEVAAKVGAKVTGDPDRPGYLGSWMEIVDDDAPERTTSSNEVLEKQRQDSRRAQAGGQVPGEQPPATGDADVFGD